MADAGDDTPHISITTGILVALGASWLSSLGLTIQRKSHLLNERQPQHSRRRDFKRPLWLLGFAIFITSNVLGSVFQIGALSITLLAPLGAVSLLWNAFFARILLGDVFSKFLVFGTFLIAGGAVLIAIFGVVPEKTHSLEDLIQLYSRTSFIVWMTLQAVLLIAVLAAAHWKERSLERNLQNVYIALPASSDDDDDEDEHLADIGDNAHALSEARPKRTALPAGKGRKNRRWSTPPSYLTINTGGSEGAGLDASTPPLASPTAKLVQSPVESATFNPSGPNTPNKGLPKPRVPDSAASRTSRHVSFGQNNYRTYSPATASPASAAGEPKTLKRGFRPTALRDSDSSVRPSLPHDKAEQIRLWLGIAYGSASGTMSGLCLLFAKTGVELLILTVVGNNQFKRWESWMIVLALLVCALLQLFYLNKSLRLVGPTLICPLAFCFYNLSSIFNGLMYYKQWSRLTPLQDGLMVLGIAILLGGVWIVSIKSPAEEVAEELDLVDGYGADEETGLLSPSRSSLDSREEQSAYVNDEDDVEEGDDQHEETFGELKRRMASLYQAFLLDQAGPPVGFSIGISAASPGFAIRPQHHAHHARRNTTFGLPDQLRASTGGLTSPLAPSGRSRHTHSRSDDLSPTASLHMSGSAPIRPSAELSRSTSEPVPQVSDTIEGAATSTLHREPTLSHRHRRKRSLAGEYYVGSSNPFTEQPVYDHEANHGMTSPMSPTRGGGRSRAGSAASAQRRAGSISSPRFSRETSSDSQNAMTRSTSRSQQGVQRFFQWPASSPGSDNAKVQRE